MMLDIAFGEVLGRLIPMPSLQQIAHDVEHHLLVLVKLGIAAGEEGFGVLRAGHGRVLRPDVGNSKGSNQDHERSQFHIRIIPRCSRGRATLRRCRSEFPHPQPPPHHADFVVETRRGR